MVNGNYQSPITIYSPIPPFDYGYASAQGLAHLIPDTFSPDT